EGCEANYAPAFPTFLSRSSAVHKVCGLVLWTVCGSRSVLLSSCAGGSPMDFYAILDQVIAVLRQRQRVTYRALKRQFNLDDDYLGSERPKAFRAKRTGVEKGGPVVVGTGEMDVPPPPPPPAPQQEIPPGPADAPHPPSLPAPAVPPSSDAERRQLTVLFCDL